LRLSQCNRSAAREETEKSYFGSAALAAAAVHSLRGKRGCRQCGFKASCSGRRQASRTPAFSCLPRRSAAFEPASFRDRYQDALHELVEATPRAIAEPPKVLNLMDALKRSLAQDAEAEPKKAALSKLTRAKPVSDRRQRALLLTISGGREETDAAVAEPAASTAPRRRTKTR
jgi:hypothetical protein